MDNRYKQRGYRAQFSSDESGAYMTILRGPELVANINVGIFRGGGNQPVELVIERFPDHALPVLVDPNWAKDPDDLEAL